MSKTKIFGVSVIVVLAVTIFFSFMITNNFNSTNSSVQGVNTQKTLEVVDYEQFSKIISDNIQNENFEIIDIRTPQEYATGYIPNAILIDFYDPSFSSQLDALDKSKTYAIYCNSGNRSQAALGLMGNKNFETVYDLRGGIQSWISNGGMLK